MPLGVLATAHLAPHNPCPVQNASTKLPESLSGLIERITFHNEENGWAVLKVKAKGHRDLVTVVDPYAIGLNPLSKTIIKSHNL